MTRERIIRIALHLYKLYGIKNVSMNMIAGQLGISKKTIYEQLENKDQIATVSVEFEISRIMEVVGKRQREATGALEAILVISGDISKYAASYCPAFYKDLIWFPAVQQVMGSFKNRIEEIYCSLFVQGVTEGVFLPEVEHELISNVIISQFEQLKPEYRTSVLVALLRGVCTERGIQQLDGIVREHNMTSVPL